MNYLLAILGLVFLLTVTIPIVIGVLILIFRKKTPKPIVQRSNVPPPPPTPPATTPPTPPATPQSSPPMTRSKWPRRVFWAVVIIIALMVFPKLLIAGIDYWTDRSGQITGLPNANVLTLDNAPLDHIHGLIWRYYGGQTHGPSNTVRVVSLEESNFYVVFRDGRDQEWEFRSIAGKGVWTAGKESGPFVIRMVGDRHNWAGHMTDDEYGDVDFIMKFEVQ